MQTEAPTRTIWLHVIGLSESGGDTLSAAACQALATAQIIIGSHRRLDQVAQHINPAAEQHMWPRPFAQIIEFLAQRRGRPVVLLATGDPMWYGVGVILAQHFAIHEIAIHPAPSAFSLAAARLGWPLAAIRTLTLHGRSCTDVIAYAHSGARLLILAHDRNSIAEIADLLVPLGHEDARVTLFEHMEASDESVVTNRLAACRGTPARRDFNTIALDLRSSNAPPTGLIPGLTDDAFRHDGTITKQDIRILTLAHLIPAPGAYLWDIGAGSGGIAIEWLRTAPDLLHATAFEAQSNRIEAIRYNAARLGVAKLNIVAGEVPQSLAGTEPPDAVFIGGGLTRAGVFDAALDALKPHGRLVSNAVTAAGEAQLLALMARYGGTIARLGMAHCHGGDHPALWRALTPVTQWRYRKP